MSMTATEVSKARDQDMDERALHQRMEWFFKKYAPADKRGASEFHADLMMVVQVVHRDASRETHALLTRTLAAVPLSPVLFQKPDQN